MPTPMPKSVKILWIIFAISKLKDACQIPGVVVLFIGL